MPYCVILECKNNSRNKNISKGNVSYHRFPKDDTIRKQWINATGRIKWMPSPSSTICSEHFLPSALLITDKGYRYLNPSAVPTVKIMKFLQKKNLSNAIEDPFKKYTSTFEKSNNGTSCRNEIARILIDMITQDIKSDTTSTTKSKANPKGPSGLNSPDLSIPKEGQLRWFEVKVKQKNLKIKRLQALNRKLRKKLTSAEEALKALKAKNGIK